MTAAALRAFATDYVAGLSLGDEILFDQDYPVIKPAFHLILNALDRRGMHLDPLPNLKGWRVAANEPAVVGKLTEGDGIQATRVDYAVRPVSVPMDNVFSDPDATMSVMCGKCSESWFRCDHRASVTFAKFDESWPMAKGGAA